ncbi:MAG: hypothetical protein ACK4M9_15150 [Anaerobacillus sp.]|uniref:hypothetical protein n=1 Tax=Anaerobacillus sp. TaxID=1872506 RepID=UPI003918A56C
MTSFQLIIIGLISVTFVAVISQLLLSRKLFKELNYLKSLSSKEPLNNENLKDELTATLLLKMFAIRNAVQKQGTNIHVKVIENAPKEIGIDAQLLKKYFSNQNIAIINEYWQLFDDYLNNYWVAKNGKFKTVFSGVIEKKSGDVGELMRGSEQLVLKLDQLLEDFQKLNHS